MGIIGVKVWIYHGDEVPYREQELTRDGARHRSRPQRPALGHLAPEPNARTGRRACVRRDGGGARRGRDRGARRTRDGARADGGR
jgi:hypothetical protein